MSETYVLDCSVAAKWVLPEPDREPALQIFERYASGTITLIAPDLLLAEFASLLARRCRQHEMAPAQAQQGFELMRRSAPRLFETCTLLEKALALALRQQMSLWDCVYLALAIEQDCGLLTADRRLVRAAGGRYSFLTLVQ